MFKQQHFLYSFLPTLFLAGLFLPLSAGAQFIRERVTTEIRDDFAIEPAKFEVFLDPGETRQQMYSVTNRTASAVTFSVSVEDTGATSDPNEPIQLLGGEVGPYSLTDYVTFPEETFTVASGERVTFPVTYFAPEDATPGGHYGAVIVSNAPSKLSEANSERAGATVVSRLASLAFMRVNGNVNEEGSLDDFRIVGNRYFFFSPQAITLEFLFSNRGSVHLTPYGMIRLQNMLGTTVGAVPVDAYFVMPESERYYRAELPDTVRFGRYKATLELNRSYEDITDVETLTFWVLPLRLLLFVFILIVALILLFSFFARTFELKRKR